MATGFKDLVDVIKKSPALMIAGIVGIVAVGYLLIKSAPKAPGGTSPTPAGTDQGGGMAGINGGGPGYYLLYEQETEPPINVTTGAVNVSTPPSSTVTVPGPTKTVTKTVQKPYTTSGVEQYILAQKNGGSIVDQIEKQQRAAQKQGSKQVHKTFIKAPVAVHNRVVGRPIAKP